MIQNGYPVWFSPWLWLIRIKLSIRSNLSGIKCILSQQRFT